MLKLIKDSNSNHNQTYLVGMLGYTGERLWED